MDPDPQSQEPPAGHHRPRRRAWLWPGAAVLFLGLLAGLTLALPALDPEHLVTRVAGTPEAVALLLIALMVLHNFVPVPAEAIAVCAGAALGVAAGVVTIWIGAMLGAAIAFALARHFGRRLAAADAAPRLLARVDRAWQDWGAPGLIGLRLMPLISFNLINYGAGLTSVGWWTFLWTTALGILPVLVASVAVGAGLRAQVMGPALYAILGGLFCALVLLRFLQRRRARAGGGVRRAPSP